MGGHVCPWWLAYTFDNPARRLFHKPERILGPYLKEGMTALDAGCGLGYFSLGMARLVGERGRVISVDIQQKMLDGLMRRARRAGVANIIDARLCEPDNIGVEEQVDFALAFWMVHETPDARNFFAQLRAVVKPGGALLVTEPVFHVGRAAFEMEIEKAESAGFTLKDRPGIAFSHAALLV